MLDLPCSYLKTWLLIFLFLMLVWHIFFVSMMWPFHLSQPQGKDTLFFLMTYVASHLAFTGTSHWHRDGDYQGKRPTHTIT